MPPSARRRVEHCAHLILARAEVLGPIERDWHSPIQALERRQRPGRLDRLHEQPIERRRRGAVQHQADVVVGGDRRTWRTTSRSSIGRGLLQRALMRQERRASHEEDRERRQTDVGHRVITVTPRSLALVGKTGADLAQRPDQLRNGAHPALEIDDRAPAQEKTTACCGRLSRNPQHVAYRT